MRHDVQQRIQDERGIALVMAVGILSVLMIAGTAVVFYAGSNARSAEYSADDAKAVNLAEAGMNYARAILWNSTTPTSPTTLPTSASPGGPIALEGGTIRYWGSWDSAAKTWTVSGSGTYTNPAGGAAPVARTVSSQVLVSSSLPFVAAWGYLFADTTTLCTDLKNSIQVDAPLYVRGNLCMQNNAVVLSELVRVRGNVQIKDSASIGTPADTVDQVEVRSGCRYPWSGSYISPCGTSQNVYRVNFSSTVPVISKPAAGLSSWYTNSKPGPTRNCSTGYSFPGTFDNGGGLNRSNSTQYLFPTTAYDCRVMSGTTQLGRIAYTPGNPGTLIIDGVVFFDGKLELNGNRNVVYQGRGTIYATDEIKIQNNVQLCGIAGCTTSWNPDTNLLAFVAGATADTGMLVENYTTFQGAIYVVNDYLQKNNVTMCGPVIAQELKIENGSANCYVPFSTLAPGMPGGTGTPTLTLSNVPESFTTD